MLLTDGSSYNFLSWTSIKGRAPLVFFLSFLCILYPSCPFYCYYPLSPFLSSSRASSHFCSLGLSVWSLSFYRATELWPYRMVSWLGGLNTGEQCVSVWLLGQPKEIIFRFLLCLVQPHQTQRHTERTTSRRTELWELSQRREMNKRAKEADV